MPALGSADNVPGRLGARFAGAWPLGEIMRAMIGLLSGAGSCAALGLGLFGPTEWSLPAVRLAFFATATMLAILTAACFWRPPRSAARVTVVMHRRGATDRPA